MSDGESPVMLEFWWIRSTPSLSLLSIPLWPKVVEHVSVASMSQIEIFDIQILSKQMTYLVWFYDTSNIVGY